MYRGGAVRLSRIFYIRKAGVAQVSNLLYRRFLIGELPLSQAVSQSLALASNGFIRGCGLETRDTAGSEACATAGSEACVTADSEVCVTAGSEACVKAQPKI